MKPLFLATAVLSLSTDAAPAQGCTADAVDLGPQTVETPAGLYWGRLADQYASHGDDVAAGYRTWQVTSTRPAVAGPRGSRFLQPDGKVMAIKRRFRADCRPWP